MWSHPAVPGQTPIAPGGGRGTKPFVEVDHVSTDRFRSHIGAVAISISGLVEWKPQAISADKQRALAAAYVDMRVAMRIVWIRYIRSGILEPQLPADGRTRWRQLVIADRWTV